MKPEIGADLECLDAKHYETPDGFVEWEPDFVSWRNGHDPIITKVLSDKLRLAGCLTGRLTVEDGVTWAEGWKRKMIYPNREAPFKPLLTHEAIT